MTVQSLQKILEKETDCHGGASLKLGISDSIVEVSLEGTIRLKEAELPRLMGLCTIRLKEAELPRLMGRYRSSQ